jgi:hypothetical protein
MRSVENPTICKQLDAYPGALAFAHQSAQCKEQSFNVAPLDTARDWSRKDEPQRSLVFAIHVA